MPRNIPGSFSRTGAEGFAALDEHGLHGKDGTSYFGESELDFWVASTLSRTCLKFA